MKKVTDVLVLGDILGVGLLLGCINSCSICEFISDSLAKIIRWRRLTTSLGLIYRSMKRISLFSSMGVTFFLISCSQRKSSSIDSTTISEIRFAYSLIEVYHRANGAWPETKEDISSALKGFTPNHSSYGPFDVSFIAGSSYEFWSSGIDKIPNNKDDVRIRCDGREELKLLD